MHEIQDAPTFVHREADNLEEPRVRRDGPVEHYKLGAMVGTP